MKHIFIINPVAGKGKTYKLIPEIHDYFTNSSKYTSEDYIIETTKYPGHATELARSYSAGEACRIYSVGGDGTLNEILNGIAGSASSLAVIPAGSGNDFIRSVIPDIQAKDLIPRTIEGEDRLIDIAGTNGKFYINIASMGFDAQVVHNTNYFKKLPLISGKLAYVFGLISAIFGSSSKHLEIDIDGSKTTINALLVAVGNGKYYGGGMLALPSADISDGVFEICCIEKMRRLKMFMFFPKFMKGEHSSLKEVHFYKGKKVSVVSREPIAMNVDGEVSIVSKAEYEIIPQGLRFTFIKP
ncbi:MAG: diacylglycerol kinase family lipid kinase [Clostridiales bacterium]|nr:diacylglycerol kinase family lipid kinase [Clostridiales bacterium]